MSIYVNEATLSGGDGSVASPFDSFMDVLSADLEVADTLNLVVSGSPVLLQVKTNNLLDITGTTEQIESVFLVEDAEAASVDISMLTGTATFKADEKQLEAQDFDGVIMKLTVTGTSSPKVAIVQRKNGSSVLESTANYRMIKLTDGYALNLTDNEVLLSHNADGLYGELDKGAGTYIVVNYGLFEELVYSYGSIGDLKQVFQNNESADPAEGLTDINTSDYIFYIKYNLNNLFHRTVTDILNIDDEINAGGDLLKVKDDELKKALKKIWMIYRKYGGEAGILHTDLTEGSTGLDLQIENTTGGKVSVAGRGLFNRLFRVYAKEDWKLPSAETNNDPENVQLKELYDMLTEVITKNNPLPEDPAVADPYNESEAHHGNDIYHKRVFDQVKLITNDNTRRINLGRGIITQHEEYLQNDDQPNPAEFDLRKLSLVYTFNYYYDTLSFNEDYEGSTTLYELSDKEKADLMNKVRDDSTVNQMRKIAIVFQHQE